MRRVLSVLQCLVVVAAVGLPVAYAADPTIPRAALKYRSTLTRSARLEWGLSAPVATFAAQVHQESRWDPDAESWAGARGLAQFMPATEDWFGNEVRPDLGPADAYNPGWALRALCAYDRWLYDRVDAATNCDRWAMTLSSYNGGLGWIKKDKRLAAARSLDPGRWWDNVAEVNAGRSASAWHENRNYPVRILRLLEPLYEEARWGSGVCP